MKVLIYEFYNKIFQNKNFSLYIILYSLHYFKHQLSNANIDKHIFKKIQRNLICSWLLNWHLHSKFREQSSLWDEYKNEHRMNEMNGRMHRAKARNRPRNSAVSPAVKIQYWTRLTGAASAGRVKDRVPKRGRAESPSTETHHHRRGSGGSLGKKPDTFRIWNPVRV